MNKKLLLLVCIICIISTGIYSQCKNCYQGLDTAPKANYIPHKVTPNGNGVLNASFDTENVCGLNYTSVTQLTETKTKLLNFNTNGSGFPAILKVTGMPCGNGANDTVIAAFAYWMAEYTENSIPAVDIVITNPNNAVNTFTSTCIGSGPSTCWNTTGSAAYRADVKAAVSGAGNGSYNMALTGLTNAATEVDGITIIIIYKDPRASYSGSIRIWDGLIIDDLGTPIGPNNYGGFLACDSTSNTKAFVMLGDCQNNINPFSVKDKLNGVSATFGQDFWQMDTLDGSFLSSGQTSISCTTYTNNTNDCFGWVGTGLYWQNTTCQVCTPGGGSVSIATAQLNPTCGGGCNGAAYVTVTGGTSPYTYTWSPNACSTDTATGLCGGTYSCTIQDASCPPADTTIVFTLPSNRLGVTPTILANEKCNGNCVGSAIVAVSGGNSPYTYAWTPSGGNKPTATGLCAGIYTITVTDINGCTGTDAVTITQPAIITATQKLNQVPCNSGTGSATITPAGGTSPYTYFWSPSGQTNATATGLKAGSYNITITDINGCVGTTSVTLTQPTQLKASIGTPTYPSCNGGTGSATGSGAGGTSPYTYSWSPSGQTTITATGLKAGTYSVTVTDFNGCTATASILITQPAVVSGNLSATYPACNGGTGTATVVASGGTPAYKYSWNPTGQITATATGLPAGTYTVTITDSHGCTGTANITLSQPNVLSVTASFTHASCSLPNGTATATPSGGTNPYAYSWTPSGQTNATATGLLAGTYTVKVTDNHNCTASATVTVTQPTQVQVSITGTTNVTCNGKNNGAATASGTGGTAPYGYQWSPSGGIGATGTGLTAGKYVVTIKDANGCTATAGTVITQPVALGVTISGPQIRCLGDSATYTSNVTGGTAPYIYTWTGGSGIGNPSGSVTTLQPPASITYTLTVTDANGCTANALEIFSFPPPLSVSINGASVTCSKRSANLCALATGGTGGDTYLWEPVNLSSPCVTIPASVTTIYTITVTDNCGVSAHATATVDVQPPPAVSFISNSTQGCSPLCVQFRNTTPPTGGTEMFIWNFGDGDSLREENPIYCYTKSGVYNVTLTVVSDSGCSSSLRKVGMISIYSPPNAAFTYSPNPVTILTPTVQFTDETSDGYGLGYRWWNFGDNSDSTSHLANPVHTYQDTGTYCATLIAMNDKGCSDTVTNCLIIEPQYSLYIPSAFTPNGDGMNDAFKPVGEYIRSFDMYIFDRWGMQVYHTTDITKGWDGTVHGGSTSQEDVYIYKITITDAQYNQHSYIGNVTLIK